MDLKNNKQSPFLNGVFVGAIIGAGALYLMGTKEGRKSRQKILDKSKKGLKALQKIIDEIEVTKDDIVEEIEEKIEKESPGIKKFLPKLKVNRFFKRGKSLK
jgi:gas vesicle protein